ncbi:TIR domain-containing protein [candidate division KSB1 bacterium]|nr:TIR domain-containing protein [candidate division KSB1 bacterium]
MARQNKKIFISYSDKDKEFALQLANDLRLEEVNIWIAKLDIAAGEKWDRAIEEALKFCKDFLVILSPNSINSDNVRDEIDFAVQEKKRIFPVLHKKCEIPFRLRRIEYSDFTSDYDSGLKHLLKAIKSAVLEKLPDKDIDFIGREDEIKRVHEGLKSDYNIITIDGMGGIGKTSLALEVAHECLAASQNPTFVNNDVQKFEAFIWTSAKDRELTINDVLDTIARTLEYPLLTRLPLEEKRHEVVKHLQEKRCLLIVDNFETVTDDAVRDFILKLPEPNNVKCLITNRVQNLEKAWTVSLRGMTEDEALLLIKNEGDRLGINLDALVADERNFQHFYDATGGAPLA